MPDDEDVTRSRCRVIPGKDITRSRDRVIPGKEVT